MQRARIQLFQEMPIFGGIGGEMLELLVQYATSVAVAKGGVFFREGDEARSMFVLEQGRVAILKSWKGHDYLLRHLNRGDCFGEMALIDFCPRSAAVVAVEDSKALELTTDNLYKVYQANPEQYALINMNMGREVCRRLRQADELMFQSKVEAKIIDGDGVFFCT